MCWWCQVMWQVLLQKQHGVVHRTILKDRKT
jgi:hypothetical protein